MGLAVHSDLNNMTVPNGYGEINALFGNPSNADGTLNKAWEAYNYYSCRATHGLEIILPKYSYIYYSREWNKDTPIIGE